MSQVVTAPSRDGNRRWLALGLLLIAVLVVVGLVAVPLLEVGRETAARARQASETLTRLDAAAARRPALEAELKQLRQAAPIAGLFLVAGSEGQGSAALQDLMKQTTGLAGATLITMQALPSATEPGYRRVALKVLLTADTPALQKLLHALESARPVTIVQNLYVRARSGQGAGASADRLLEINLEIVAFQRLGAG